MQLPEGDIDETAARLLAEFCWWYRVSDLEKEATCLMMLSHYLVRAIKDQTLVPQVRVALEPPLTVTCVGLAHMLEL